MKKVRYIDLPKGARFKHNPDDKDVWIVLEQHGRGKMALELPDGMVGKEFLCLQTVCCVTEEGQLLEDVEVYLPERSVWVLFKIVERSVQYGQIDIHAFDRVFFSKPSLEKLSEISAGSPGVNWSLKEYRE